MFTVANVLQALRDWAPFELAWERDNIGLLVGSRDAEVRRSLICLDLTEEVAKEAASLKCDLIVAHHPLIFHPLKSVDLSTEQGRILQICLTNSIAVVAMHTNADATFGGLNHGLADLLGLTGIRSLAPVHGEREMVTLFADPADGKTETFFEQLKQMPDVSWTAAQFENGLARIEVQAPRWHSKGIRSVAELSFGNALLDQHTTAINGKLEGYGIGAIGTLAKPMTPSAFVDHVKATLECAGVRTTPIDEGKSISTIAVCGGSGSSFIRDALSQGADAMVTSDLTYHSFQDHRNDILLVDAGHYETEVVFIRLCKSVLERTFSSEKNKNIEFISTRTVTNPVRFA